MRADGEEQIRTLLETRTRAFGHRDVATAAAYSKDRVLFDAVGPFVRRGEASTDRLEKWIDLYRTGIGHEIRDLEITAGADLAFCHFLVRISDTMRDGIEVAMWVRATTCLHRQRNEWTTGRPITQTPRNAQSTRRFEIEDRGFRRVRRGRRPR